VIGINSAIASESGFYQGFGFAIPINLARRVMEDLVEYGQVRRAMLGVSIGNVTPEDATVYGLPSIAGALVSEVRPGEPAERAGIRGQDVIVAIDGKPVAYPGQLQQRVAQFRPGDQVTVTLYRERRSMDVRVRLGEAPLSEQPQALAAATTTVAEQRLGFQVEPITLQNMGLYGFTEPGGVVISAIEPGSAVERSRVQAGWKIESINDRPISDPAQVRTALEQVQPGEVVTFTINHPRAPTPRIVNVRMPG
jgi:serine protease Do